MVSADISYSGETYLEVAYLINFTATATSFGGSSVKIWVFWVIQVVGNCRKSIIWRYIWDILQEHNWQWNMADKRNGKNVDWIITVIQIELIDFIQNTGRRMTTEFVNGREQFTLNFHTLNICIKYCQYWNRTLTISYLLDKKVANNINYNVKDDVKLLTVSIISHHGSQSQDGYGL